MLAVTLLIALGAAPADTLKLATWNLEWLVAPATFKTLKASCVSAGVRVAPGERRLPCDVAWRFERSHADFAALARYARRLDADVVALQEVDGPEAARRVFPGYSFCFTRGTQIQNNGFAIRAGLPFRCGPDLQALSLGDSVRRGAELTLFPGETRELRLLSVHLKSGCPSEPLDSGRDACRQLAQQVPVLEGWIDAQASAGRRFAVLGDFNRILLRERGAGVWAALDDAVPPGADLVDAAAAQPFLNCTPGQSFAGYVDAIVVGASLGKSLVPGSFDRVTYTAREAHRFRLSDHCPIGVRIHLTQFGPPSTI